MKKVRLIILSLMVLCINSCFDKSGDTRDIKIYNRSNGVVYCLKSKSDSFKYPYIKYQETIVDKYHKIKKNNFIYLDDNPREWESYINNDCKNGKLRLFIISKDSIDKYGWGKVLINNLYTKVYKLDIEDLKKRNWEIIYNMK